MSRFKFPLLAALAVLALTSTAESQQQPRFCPFPCSPEAPASPERAPGTKPKKLFTFKAAVVALTEDPTLRADFERGLVAKAREHRYDAITSYDVVPNLEDAQSRKLVKALTAKGVKGVLMVRPAAIGPGSSLDALKDAVSPAVLADMKSFAKSVSRTGGSDPIAIVHLGIYMIDLSKPEPVNSGAVWLDEPVQDRAEGIDRIQDLIIANLDAARPAIRKHLGMPPLPE
jgi:hypothetical protein